MLRYVVPAIWALLATLCGQTAAAAIDAKISFETEIPKAFVCGENSTAELSGLHYKDGSRSLRWSWSAPPDSGSPSSCTRASSRHWA